MKTRRTKEMIIEIERVRVVCQRTPQTVSRCRECRTEMSFVTVAEAAQIIEADAPTIFRLTETSVLHSLSAANGEIGVCLVSVMDFEANRFR